MCRQIGGTSAPDAARPMDIIFKDYYQILGIAKGATLDEIKGAFRKKARETHPDATGDAANYERFVLVREAFDVLTRPAHRAAYDELYEEYYREAASAPHGDYLKSVIDDFDVATSGSYRDEWEFFVRHPDDYLGLFESTVKLVLGMLLSVAGGIVAPVAAFFGVIALSGTLALLAAVSIAAVAALSLSSLAGAVVALLALRRVMPHAKRLKDSFVVFLGRFVVYPLRGIPKRRGSWVLYLNYLIATIAMAAFGYFTASAYWRAIIADAAPGGVSAPVLVFVGAVCGAVVVFTASVVLIFEIIQEAFKSYPDIRYSRFRVPKGAQIGYAASQGLVGGNERPRIR